MKKAYIIHILLILSQYMFGMKDLKIENGLWIKTQEKTYENGWKIIVGPDAIFVNDDRIEMFYFHISKSYSYKLLGENLIENDTSLDYKLSMLNDKIIEFSNNKTMFLYFHCNGDSVNVEDLMTNLPGKWLLEKDSNMFFNFKNEKIVDTGENLLEYKLSAKIQSGKWSVFNWHNYQLLEMHMEGHEETRLFAIDRCNKNEMAIYFINEYGERKDIQLCPSK